jgi:guanylate kinase
LRKLISASFKSLVYKNIIVLAVILHFIAGTVPIGTTRPPRGSERNGHEYFFVSREEFERMVAADDFLEYANVFGHYYGTARRFLDQAKEQGYDLLAARRC